MISTEAHIRRGVYQQVHGSGEDAVLQLGASVGLSLSWPTGWPAAAAHEDAGNKQCTTLRGKRQDSPSAPRPRPGGTSPRQRKRRAPRTRREVCSDRAPDFVVY